MGWLFIAVPAGIIALWLISKIALREQNPYLREMKAIRHAVNGISLNLFVGTILILLAVAFPYVLYPQWVATAAESLAIQEIKKAGYPNVTIDRACAYRKTGDEWEIAYYFTTSITHTKKFVILTVEYNLTNPDHVLGRITQEPVDVPPDEPTTPKPL